MLCFKTGRSSWGELQLRLGRVDPLQCMPLLHLRYGVALRVSIAPVLYGYLLETFSVCPLPQRTLAGAKGYRVVRVSLMRCSSYFLVFKILSCVNDLVWSPCCSTIQDLYVSCILSAAVMTTRLRGFLLNLPPQQVLPIFSSYLPCDYTRAPVMRGGQRDSTVSFFTQVFCKSTSVLKKPIF